MILFSCKASAQRLSFGYNYDFIAIHYTSFSEDVIFSHRTYRAFYVNKSNLNISKAMAISYVMVLDYGRFSLFADMGIFNDMDGKKIKLNYPVANQQYATYYSRVKSGAYRINAVTYYSFNTAKSFKPSFGAGISNVFPITVTEDVSTYKDFSKAWFDVYEVKPNYRLDKFHTNYILAAGFKSSSFALILKYNFRWNKNVENNNFSGFLNFGFYSYLNFSNLRRNYLYFD